MTDTENLIYGMLTIVVIVLIFVSSYYAAKWYHELP